MGVVVEVREEPGLAVVEEVRPEGDDGNVEQDGDGGQDVDGMLQGDEELSFGLVEWHVDCLTTNSTVFPLILPLILPNSSSDFFMASVAF